MAFDPTYAVWVAAGALMLALATMLVRYGVGRAPNLLLALALTMHGTSSILLVLDAASDGALPWLARSRPYFQLAIAPSFVAFAIVYPRPLRLPGPRFLTPIALGALILIGPCAYFVDHALWQPANSPLRAYFNALLLVYGALAYVLLREWARAPADAPARGALLATSLAFALIHLYDAVVGAGAELAAWSLGMLGPSTRTWLLLADVLTYVPFAALLAKHRREVAAQMRSYVPLVAASVVLAVMVLTIAILVRAEGFGAGAGVADGIDRVVRGLADLTFPVILAYAVLRHQLLDIDVKLRWTISKSTIAAAFVAVFFLASEGAQLLLGQRNAYVGLLGAAALVFAMAPLQRAAERLAERAVPVGPSAPAHTGAATPREEAYKRALRIALRDRTITREEEVHLHEVAEHMGIGAGRAMALRVEVERELGDDQRASR